MNLSHAIKTRYHNAISEIGHRISLRTFARRLLEQGDEQVRLWFANKGGALEKQSKATRLKNKGAQLTEIRMKVRQSRRNGGSAVAKPEKVKKEK